MYFFLRHSFWMAWITLSHLRGCWKQFMKICMFAPAKPSLLKYRNTNQWLPRPDKWFLPSAQTQWQRLKAINWMEEFRLEHLPLVDGVNYIGLASEEDILKLSALDQALANHNLPLIRPFVRYNQPVFEVVKLISKDKLTNRSCTGCCRPLHRSCYITRHSETLFRQRNFEDANGVIVLEVGSEKL